MSVRSRLVLLAGRAAVGSSGLWDCAATSCSSLVIGGATGWDGAVALGAAGPRARNISSGSGRSSGDDEAPAGPREQQQQQQPPTAADAPVDTAWREMVAAAASDPARLAAIVATLHRHCLLTQASPPLPAFNALLRLANAARDRASADRLAEVLHANRMQADAETWARLREHADYAYLSPALAGLSASAAAAQRGPRAPARRAPPGAHGP